MRRCDLSRVARMQRRRGLEEKKPDSDLGEDEQSDFLSTL